MMEIILYSHLMTHQKTPILRFHILQMYMRRINKIAEPTLPMWLKAITHPT